MIAALLAAAALASDPFPHAAASYLVAIDGEVVWERDADMPRLPASLTKLMTALVLVEGPWDAGAAVKVDAKAAAATGSRAGLKAGETLAAGDLLTAMLVASANDACWALAGDPSFVAKMNARAKEIGLVATTFANPCGHDDPKQRSSARDLYVIAQLAMSHTEIASRVVLVEATIRTEKGRKITLKTGNHLLGRCEGAYGVKSGYTPGAGKCLVGAARRGPHDVVIVLLDADDRWWTAAGLVEAAFDEATHRPR